MKFSTVATALAGVNVAFGARFTKLRKQRHAARDEDVALRGKGGPANLEDIVPSDLPTVSTTLGLRSDDLDARDNNGTTLKATYTQNWAGSLLVGPANGFKSVTGTFVVPTPKIPTGGNSATQYAASIWVGIDGASSTTSILQTGIDVFVQGGTIGFDAWYEWYPDYAYDFTGITISAGDTIQLTVTASSTTGGTAYVKNLTKGQSVFKSFAAQPALQEVNAEWIVEDFQNANGAYVPFANFGTVTFTSCTATGPTGPVPPNGGTLLDIKQNNQILTQTSLTSSSLIVSHT